MTASLPLPDDESGGRPSPAPPLPALSAADAAADATQVGDASRGGGAAKTATVKKKTPRRRPPRRAVDTPEAGHPAFETSAPSPPSPPPPIESAADAAARREGLAALRPQPPEPAAPEIVESEAVEPEVVEPEVVEPEVVEPEVVEPEVVEPEVVEPEVVEPEVVGPEVVEPEVDASVATADALDDDALLLLEPDAADESDGVAADPLAGLDLDVDEAVPAIRLSGVTKTFGTTRAVDDIELNIPAGTFFGIVGPNGAGKTTTLSMIAGLLRADTGTIEVTGIDLVGDPARAKRRMGILPDRLRTFDRLTGRQLLHYYGVLRGLRSAVVESRIADLARAFDLTDALGRTVSDYSTGMTKKLMLAGAMIHSPRVLVLDEPFESVDPVSSAVILDILSAYVAHGGTVVLSSHGMDLVERVCSGVAVIVAGRVLAAGTVAEVRGELTLEQRFIELSGGSADAEGLEWLHTFSD